MAALREQQFKTDSLRYIFRQMDRDRDNHLDTFELQVKQQNVAQSTILEIWLKITNFRTEILKKTLTNNSFSCSYDERPKNFSPA